MRRAAVGILLAMVSSIAVSSAGPGFRTARAQDEPSPGGAAARGARREDPRPVEVADVWFPGTVAKQGLRQNGAWLPIYVELKSLTGREELAVLEATATSRFEKEKLQPFRVRKTVKVAPGAPRRAWLMMRVAPSDQQLISLRVTVPRDDETAGGSPEQNRSGVVVVFRQDLGSADSYDLSGSGASMISALLVGENLTQVIPRSDWFRLGQFGTQSALVQDHCRPSALPDTLLGYQPFDVVVVRDISQERLEPSQITALRQWVFMGGFVVLAASTESGDVLRSELARTLIGDEYIEPKTDAFTVEADEAPPGAIVMVQHEEWQRQFGADSKDVLVPTKAMELMESQSFTIVDPVAGDGSRGVYLLGWEESLALEQGMRSLNRRSRIGQPPVSLEGARRLYAELEYGRGHVGVVTFVDQSFGPRNEAACVKPIWERILGSHSYGGTPLSRRAARFAESSIVTDLRDTSRDIGFSFIVALVVVYLLLVGPGIYFFLKRLNRLPSLIWVEPLVVLLYLGVVIVAGYVSKGAITKARQWTLISQRVGDDLAVRESYLAVFAGAEADYEIGSPGGILLKPLFADADAAGGALGRAKDGTPSIALEEDGRGGRRLTGLHLRQWAEGYAVNLDVLEMDPDGGVQVEVLDRPGTEPNGSAGDDTLGVRIVNRLPYDILSGKYVHEVKGEFLLPAVEAGAALESRLRRAVDDESGLPENLSRVTPLAGAGFFGSGSRARAKLVAVIDRTDADYDEEWHTNLRERLDLFLLHGKQGN